MDSLPLDVADVLEQEYEARYQQEPPPLPNGVLYDDAQITDGPFARSILAACGLNDRNQTVESLLNGVVQSGTGIEKLASSPVLSTIGAAMLQQLDAYATGRPDGVKEHVRRRVVDEAFCGAVKPLRDARLSSLYSELHKKGDTDARSALCISGGGIRSATFALGVIQGLASAGILDKFDFLSTVSGGGYIGSWLSSWARRHPNGMTGVQKDLLRCDSSVGGTKSGNTLVSKSDMPETDVDPEEKPVRHLREYSNYLSPRLGLTSADSWTIAALYIRNLLLNLLVLVPILAFVIAFPRFFAWLLGNQYVQRLTATQLLTAAVAFIAIGFGYIGSARPVLHGRKGTRGNANARFVIGCIVPLTVAATLLAVFWARESPLDDLLAQRWFWMNAGAAWLLMIAAPFVPYYWRMGQASPSDRREPVRGGASIGSKFGFELLAAFLGIVTNAALLFVLANNVFRNPLVKIVDPNRTNPILRPLVDNGTLSSLYICLAVPLVLLVFFIQATVFVGLSSRVNEDSDREWWGRAGAWLMIASFGLAVASLVSVFGPVLLYHAPVIVASLGGASGIAAALIGNSSKTSATKGGGESSTSSVMSKIGSALLVPLFCLALVAAISLGTTWVCQKIAKPSLTVVTKLDAQLQSSAEEKATVTAPGHHFVQTISVPKSAAFSVADSLSAAHLKTIQDTTVPEIALLLGIAVLAVLLSLAIGVNRFSMHAFYRNRLIRAYLGASRYNRDPDRFTGFDANDNLQMYELRQDLLWPSQFGSAAEFVKDLAEKKESDSVAAALWKELDPLTQERIKNGQRDAAVSDAVTLHINAILTDRGKSFAGKKTAREKRDAIATISDNIPSPRRGPMHVVNTTLNLTAGENLAWQERRAESFTVSPMHCGSFRLGYRDAREYGGGDGISLGTAVTISGAAASPNMGYNSSPPLAFLLTLLNVRLGAWLGNPGVAGDKTFGKAHPDSNLRPLLAELTGVTSDDYEWIYLSDGGHFENLALYEMVLRRCRYIIVSDGGCDPTFTFDDLGNAIRKIRIDLGVPIEVRKVDMYPRAEPGQPLKNGSYMAVGTIRYGAIDKGAPDGILIYVKPSIYASEFLPRDVYNYAQQSATFPHETTGDQFFSESQFESYRALGRYVVNEMCGNYEGAAETTYANTYGSVAEFFDAVAPVSPGAQQPMLLVKAPTRSESTTSGPAATGEKEGPRT